jgi:ABC-type transport system substrate-binding protein
MRISTPDVALVSLQKGDIDLVNPLDPTAIPGLKGLPTVQFVEGKDSSQWYGLERNFFSKNGMWRNPKAVQGLWYAIDRQAYVNSILQGYGVVRNSFYDGTPYACPSLTKYDYKADMAKQLWGEVGMPKDQPITFMSWTGIKPRLDFLPIAQAAVQKLGYKSEVDIIDNSLIDDYINGKGPRGKNWDFHVLLYGMGADPGTPEAFVDPKSTSNWGYRTWPEEPDASGKKHPAWVYDNAKMSALLVQGRQESDPTKRAAIYQQIDCMWNQDLPCLMIASPSHMIAMSTRLQGVDWQTNAGIGEWTTMFKPGNYWVTS